jgi:hypothetical protein
MRNRISIGKRSGKDFYLSFAKMAFNRGKSNFQRLRRGSMVKK